jgi:hypothetical protein
MPLPAATLPRMFTSPDRRRRRSGFDRDTAIDPIDEIG